MQTRGICQFNVQFRDKFIRHFMNDRNDLNMLIKL